MNTVQHPSSASRVLSFYRDKDHIRRWNPRDPWAVFTRQAIEREMQAAAAALDLDLEAATVIDLGCGTGIALRYLVEMGATPANMHGVELVPERVEKARSMSHPDMTFTVGDVTDLPDLGRFDVVMQSGTMCNLLADDERERMAAWMRRAGDAIVWYDLTGHASDQIRPVSRAELLEHFQGWTVVHEKPLFRPGSEARVARRGYAAATSYDQRGRDHAALFAVLIAP